MATIFWFRCKDLIDQSKKFYQVTDEVHVVDILQLEWICVLNGLQLYCLVFNKKGIWKRSWISNFNWKTFELTAADSPWYRNCCVELVKRKWKRWADSLEMALTNWKFCREYERFELVFTHCETLIGIVCPVDTRLSKIFQAAIVGVIVSNSPTVRLNMKRIISALLHVMLFWMYKIGTRFLHDIWMASFGLCRIVFSYNFAECKMLFNNLYVEF
jgi:hypothetical protein